MSGETIKGLVAAHGKLYVRGEHGLYTLKNNGKEPRDWDQAHFSAAPADRPFTDFFFDDIHELVNGSAIDGEDRRELRDAIMVMVTVRDDDPSLVHPYRSASPWTVILSVMTSCGMRAYFHGLPPVLATYSVAEAHHFTAAACLSLTCSSSRSALDFGSSM
jgi:hypothetical protein